MQLHRSVVAVILLTALGLNGCATHATYFDVRHAPELRMGGIRSIKIEAFRIGKCVLVEPSYWKEVFIDILVENTMDAVFGKDGVTEKTFRENVAKAITSNSAYTITTADDFDVLIKGQISCNTSGTIDRNRTKTNDGKESYSYQLEQAADVSVEFSVVDRLGKTRGTSEVTASERITRTGTTTAEMRSVAERPASLVDKALTKAAELLVRKIAPYTVRERRTLATSDSPAIKNGNEAAEKGNWQNAARFWRDASQSANRSDRIASLNNLAIYDEFLGELGEARKKYEQIHSLTLDRKYELEAARIKTQIEEETWLRTEFGQK